MREENLAKIREIYAADRFASENGAMIEAVGPNYAKCSLKVEHRHLNAAGAVMGGVYFTLADFAFAVATDGESSRTVSLHADIDFLGAARLGDVLTAETTCIKNGRTICLYQIRIADSSGKQVAVVSITGFCKK